MQHLGNYLIVFLLVASASTTVAQKVMPIEEQEASLRTAMDLYTKEKYAPAQQIFDQTAQYAKGVMAADASYYAAVCASLLDNDDAPFRMEGFIKNYGYSSHVPMAHFYLANFYYTRGKFDEALKQYRQIESQSVDASQRAEYNFKLGYCYLQADDLKHAKSCFLQQKDSDNRYRAASLYYYAHIQYTEGDYHLALDNFRQLENDSKFAPIVPNYIIRIYYYTGQHDKVIEMAPTMLANHDTYKPIEIEQMVAEILFNRGNYAEAIKHYNIAMTMAGANDDEPSLVKGKKKGPSRAACTPQDNYYQMGYCYYMLEQYDSAATYLEKKTACMDSVAQHALFTLADVYIHQDRKEDARTMFLQASKLTFDETIQEEALFCHAKLSCELKQNPYNESIKSFQNYLRRYPKTKHKQEVQEIMASLYLTTNNYKDALTLLEGIDNRSTKLNKAYQRILLNYGIELFNKGKVGTSSDYFLKATKVNADVQVTANANYLYGESQYRQGNHKVARKSIDRFLLSSHAKQSPHYAQALYTQGYVCMEEKDYDEAIEHFEAFVKNAQRGGVNTHQIADANNRIGDCHYVSRQYKDAITSYARVITADDDDADYATMQTALAYGALGNDQTKFTYLQRVAERYPKSSLKAKALLETANTYMKLDNSSEALLHYKEYLRKYPKSSQAKEALLSMGLIYYNSQRDDEALEVMDRLLRDHAKTDEARYAIGTIKNIYTEQNRLDEYFEYIQKTTHISISDMEQDSTIYLAAEDRYMSGEYAQAAIAMEGYLKKFPQGLFAQKAEYYAADSYYRTMHGAKALPHYLQVLKQNKNQYTEESMLRAAGIAFEQKDYPLADSLYSLMASRAEEESNRIIGHLGVMRCCVLQELDNRIDDAADALLAESRITSEHSDEALLAKARLSYKRQSHTSVIARYERLLHSTNGDYSGEAWYRTAEAYYLLDDIENSEKTINTYVADAASDYWLAKTFILWADIYFNVYHNNLQAKQTLQSIIDNYDGEELVDIALKKRNSIIESEMPEQKPEEKEITIEIE